MSVSRNVMVIDLFGLDAPDVRARFPEVYQHVSETVKPARDENRRAYRRENWWLFGENNPQFRKALDGLPRYIATVETAKHRVFQFLDAEILPDNMLVCIALNDGHHLGVLSSRVSVAWALRAGGWLGVGNDPRYSKSRCFDPFPFPECRNPLKEQIREIAEELDAHRKSQQSEHPKLTLTQMYNVLEKLRSGEPLDDTDKQIKQDGLVVILKELHDNLDALVFEAYGWPTTLNDEEILERLVALNKKRALEEKVGLVKWLRPDYQIPKFGTDVEKARLKHERDTAKAAQDGLPIDELAAEDASKPKYPTEKAPDRELQETAAVLARLAAADGPLSAEDIAVQFSRGRANTKRVQATLDALSRMGHVASDDGGTSYQLAVLA